jgi:aspartyl-tRNA synthetase
MDTQSIAQVANFLNVSPNQIKRCEEWASVIFVVVQGRRPRFVSKKVLVMKSQEVSVESLIKELKECPIPVRSCDPFQVWESHPVVSRYLDLRDREIAAAIDAAQS